MPKRPPSGWLMEASPPVPLLGRCPDRVQYQLHVVPLSPAAPISLLEVLGLYVLAALASPTSGQRQTPARQAWMARPTLVRAEPGHHEHRPACPFVSWGARVGKRVCTVATH